MPALIMGAIAGFVCYWACSKLKHGLGYDDALDAFGIHGVGGTLGAILTGVFATRACLDVAGGQPLGIMESGSPMLLVRQTMAVLVTIAISAIGSLVLLQAVDILIGLRVPAESEQRGLDLTDHGEEGYLMA